MHPYVSILLPMTVRVRTVASVAFGALFVPVVLHGQLTSVLRPERMPQQRYTGEASRTPIGHVGTALLGRDTTVYVLDPENNIIHVAQGSSQLRTVSRRGSGPGEMRGGTRMSFLGDSVVVPDGNLQRVTIFPLAGGPVRTVKVAPARARGFYGVSAVAYGETAILMLGSNVSGNSAQTGMSNDLALFLRRHGSTRITKVAHLSRGDIGFSVPVLLRGRPANMSREQPFASTPSWDFARDGGGAAVLDVSAVSPKTVTVRIRQWSNAGRLFRTCTVERPRRPLTNAAYERGLLSVGPPPSGRGIVEPDWSVIRENVRRPQSLPPFRSVRLASDGTIWVRTEASFASTRDEYLVFAPSGCAAPRTISLPLGLTVEDARGSLFITSGYVDDAPVVDMWRY